MRYTVVTLKLQIYGCDVMDLDRFCPSCPILTDQVPRTELIIRLAKRTVKKRKKLRGDRVTRLYGIRQRYLYRLHQLPLH